MTVRIILTRMRMASWFFLRSFRKERHRVFLDLVLEEVLSFFGLER